MKLSCNIDLYQKMTLQNIQFKIMNESKVRITQEILINFLIEKYGNQLLENKAEREELVEYNAKRKTDKE